jgi:hypothetical protein
MYNVYIHVFITNVSSLSMLRVSTFSIPPYFIVRYFRSYSSNTCTSLLKKVNICVYDPS